MSTAVRKQQPDLPDWRDTETHRIVRLETATETMMDYIGYLNTEIMSEEASQNPNRPRIEALEAQMQAVSRERHTITPDDEKLIAKALYVYAPIMKALRGTWMKASS